MALALRYFDKQHQRRLKGNRDLCAPRKSIESDYPEREQVESQGGPRHVCNLSLSLLPLPLLWRHGCQPCKCSVGVIREQRGPRQSAANLQTGPPETKRHNKPQPRVKPTSSASPLVRWAPSEHNQEPSCRKRDCKVNDI